MNEEVATPLFKSIMHGFEPLRTIIIPSIAGHGTSPECQALLCRSFDRSSRECTNEAELKQRKAAKSLP